MLQWNVFFCSQQSNRTYCSWVQIVPVLLVWDMFHPVQDLGDTMLLWWSNHQELLLGQVHPQTVTSRTSALEHELEGFSHIIYNHAFFKVLSHGTWKKTLVAFSSGSGQRLNLLLVWHMFSTFHWPDQIKWPIFKRLLQSICNLEGNLLSQFHKGKKIRSKFQCFLVAILCYSQRLCKRFTLHKRARQRDLDVQFKANHLLSHGHMFYSWKRRVVLTKSVNPWEAVITFPLAAWTGLRVMALTFASYLRAK